MKTRRWWGGVALAALATLVLTSLACSAISLGRATPTPAPVPTTDAKARQIQVFEAAWTAVRDQYVRPDYDGVDWEAVGQAYRAKVEAGLDEEAFYQAMRDMLAELPEGQASFQTRAERLEAETSATSLYEGIGAFIAFREEPEPHVVILSVIEDSPAEKAGLEAHDSIYSIDGTPVQPGEAETVADRIRGPADSSVTLTVQSPAGERREVTIPRGQINAVDGLRGGHIESLDIVYYRVPVAPDLDMAELIAQNLSSLQAETQLKGVVLDLRVARSGSQGWPLGGMLTLFGDGELGKFYGQTDNESVSVEGQDVNGSQSLPLVILIGPDTQGSPEVFAGALHGAKKAILIGLPTPGEVQRYSEVPLPDGSRLFLATSSFQTLDGTDLAKTGLTPDVLVESDWDSISSDNDPALEAALRLLLDN